MGKVFGLRKIIMIEVVLAAMIWLALFPFWTSFMSRGVVIISSILFIALGIAGSIILLAMYLAELYAKKRV